MKPRRTLQSTFTGIFILLLLFFVGCKRQKAWKIGVMAPMTGSFANYGILINKAVQLAVQEYGEQYGQIGNRDIQLLLEDTQSDEEIAKAELKKLTEEENVLAIIGPLRSPVGVVIAGDAQKAQTPMIATATNPVITENGDYIFRTTANSALPAKILAHYLVQKRGLLSLAIFYIADAYSTPIAQSAADTFAKLGGEILANIGLPPGPEDFRSYLEELAPSVPAAIFLPVYPADFANFLAQFRKDPRFENTLVFGGATISNNQLFLELAGNTAEGVIVVAASPKYSYKRQYFDALYKVSFGMKPDIFATHSYDSTIILLDAMRRTYQTLGRMNVSTLRQEIQNTSITGVTGKIEFAANGDAKKSITIMEIQGQSYKRLETYFLEDGFLLKVWD